MLSKKELNSFVELIEREKEKLYKELGFIKENALNQTTKDATGDHSSYSFHMADQGTDSQEREKAFMFASRESKYIEKLDLALKRIENGTYGVCFKCKKDIGTERLEAVPIATMCVECKNKS